MNNRKSERLLSAIGGLSDDLILSAVQEKEKKVRGRKPRWVAALVAAVLALILVVGAGAAGVIPGLSNVFSPAFYYEEGEEGPDMELLEKLGQPIGVSVEKQGVTVTLQSVLRDRYTLTAVLSVHKNGLEGNTAHFDWNWMKIGDRTLAVSGSRTKDMVPGDDSQEYVVTWEEEEPIPTGKMELTLENLVLNDHQVFREKRIQDKWTLEFEADIEDLSRNLPAGQRITTDGGEVVLEEITLSPLSLLMKLTGLSEEGWDGPDFTITMKDGTELFNILYHGNEKYREDGSEDDGSISRYAGSRVHDGDSFRFTYTANFSRLVPFEEIESLVIEGQEIPLQ